MCLLIPIGRGNGFKFRVFSVRIREEAPSFSKFCMECWLRGSHHLKSEIQLLAREIKPRRDRRAARKPEAIKLCQANRCH